jgi:hypothetical protein
MRTRIITECFFDTMLIEKIIQDTKNVWHRRGCNNVIIALTDNKVKDDFKIGVIDKDKKSLQYLNNLKSKEIDGFNFYYSEDKLIVIIELNPPLESWILDICKMENFDLETIGLYNDVKRLKDYTKYQLVNESEKLRKLISFIMNCNNERVENLKKCINHLILEKNNFNLNSL